jgi:hypothetical protein
MLGGRGAPGDGARDEDDELLHTRPLEVLKVAHVQRLRQYHWIQPLRTALQHRQRCDLHLSLSLSLSFSLSLLRVWMLIAVKASYLDWLSWYEVNSVGYEVSLLLLQFLNVICSVEIGF